MFQWWISQKPSFGVSASLPIAPAGVPVSRFWLKKKKRERERERKKNTPQCGRNRRSCFNNAKFQSTKFFSSHCCSVLHEISEESMKIVIFSQHTMKREREISVVISRMKVCKWIEKSTFQQFSKSSFQHDLISCLRSWTNQKDFYHSQTTL